MSTDGSAVAERPTASSEPVLYEVCDSGVAVMTFNRPERMNAWGGGDDVDVSSLHRCRRGRPAFGSSC